MNWKQKLIAATGAFVAMPVATLAQAASVCGARRSVRSRRRTSSVPMIVAPGDEIAISGRLLKIAEPAGNAANNLAPACEYFKISVDLVDTYTGDVIKTKTYTREQGTGFVAAFDIEEYGGAVSADVVVEPAPAFGDKYSSTSVGGEACRSAPVQTSFSVKGNDGTRTYVPSANPAFHFTKIDPY